MFQVPLAFSHSIYSPTPLHSTKPTYAQTTIHAAAQRTSKKKLMRHSAASAFIPPLVNTLIMTTYKHSPLALPPLAASTPDLGLGSIVPLVYGK